MDLAIKKEESDHELVIRRSNNELDMETKRSANHVELLHLQSMNKERQQFLKGLSDIGVDLTKYLCAEVSSKPTSHLLIENHGDESAHNLHIH